MHKQPKRVAELVDEFVGCVARGEQRSLTLSPAIVVTFAEALAREAVGFAVRSIESIECPELRTVITASLVGLTGGALVGVYAGQKVGGVSGAVIGGVVGGVVGAATLAWIAVVYVEQRPDGRVTFAALA